MQSLYALLALLLAITVSSDMITRQGVTMRNAVRREAERLAAAVALNVHELIRLRSWGNAQAIHGRSDICRALGGTEKCSSIDDFDGQNVEMDIVTASDTLRFHVDVQVRFTSLSPQGEYVESATPTSYKMVRVTVRDLWSGREGALLGDGVSLIRVYPALIK